MKLPLLKKERKEKEKGGTTIFSQPQNIFKDQKIAWAMNKIPSTSNSLSTHPEE